jgi:very-short-patch-repair endonuclease
MGAKKGEARDAAAWGMARRQHGVVSRAGLIALGFGGKAIKHRIAIGRLHPVHAGIYAVGRPDLTREGRWMAAVLACGPSAALSHLSAAALWGVAAERGGRIDVSVRRRRAPKRPGIQARARPSLAAAEVTTHRGIQATSPVQTLVDVATELPERRLERAVNEADKLDLIDPEELAEALGDHRGEPGMRPLGRLLARRTFRLSDDELELLFRPLAAAAGLPRADTKVLVNGFEVDFFWPRLGLVVETDGFRYHRTASTQSRDALRDQTHTAAGLTPLRFSHWQVKYEPARVRRVLAATAARLRRPGA